VKSGDTFRLQACLLAVTLAGGTAPARAQCTYTPLTSTVATTVSASPQPCSFNQGQPFYTGVAVRSAPGDDWNIEVYQSTDVFPACVATLLAGSSRTSGVDFVVGDFNSGHNATGLYYPLATRASGSGNATVEWDDGNQSLALNNPLVSRSTGANDVIEVWDVSLSAGTTYTFTFTPTGADLKLLLFKSGSGAYWAGRNSALFEVTATTTFPATATGFYGVVVINDDGATGSYSLGVGRCDMPTPLASGTSVTTTRAEKYYSFNQSALFWSAVGARGSDAASNWNVEVYGSSSGGAYPVCLSNLLSGSNLAAPSVDFVAGNFGIQTPAIFYPRVFLDQDQGSGSATVEWDDGGTLADNLVPDDPPVSRSTGPTDVLEAWDIFLDVGATYHFQLNGGANLKLFLFSPTATWVKRADAVFQMPGGPSLVPYTATESDFHGLVVVNEDGTSGSYSVWIGSTLVAVGDEPPPVTGLRGVAPNPARGKMQISFSLHEPALVSFQVLDVAGRLVSEVPAREWNPGKWSVGWIARGPASARLHSGIYFLRMKASGRTIAIRKFALVE